jgi:hypothetical protein
MKTKKMENILQFVDKNMKFKSEIRGKRRVTSKRTYMSKTLKNKSKHNGNRINGNRINGNRNRKIEKGGPIAPDVEKHPDGFIKLKCSPKLQENDFTCYSNNKA